MYREAIAKKKKGAVIGSVIICIFMIVTLFIALKYPAAWALFGFCALFAVLMIFSVIHNSRNIKKMEQNYPGSLELEVDNCDPANSVAGKYFFLPTHLIDPFNARMIKYEDIKSVKATETYDGRHDAKAAREGRIVTIKKKNMAAGEMPYIFNDFSNGMTRVDKETVENYEKFMELLNSHVGEDVEVTMRQL